MHAVVTFGCRVNQADSLEIEGELPRAAASACRRTDADVVIVNTVFGDRLGGSRRRGR